MRNTESFFGLENHDGRITPDAGKTYLKPYSSMTATEFYDLVAHIEKWRDENLSTEELDDLEKILA